MRSRAQASGRSDDRERAPGWHRHCSFAGWRKGAPGEAMRWLQASSFLDDPAGLEPEAFTEADVSSAPAAPADRPGGDADDYADYSVTYHLDRQPEQPPTLPPLPTACAGEHDDPSFSGPFDHAFAFAFAGWVEDEPTEPGFALPVAAEPSAEWEALDAGWEAAV
jgi:hypothetical protein